MKFFILEHRSKQSFVAEARILFIYHKVFIVLVDSVVSKMTVEVV